MPRSSRIAVPVEISHELPQTSLHPFSEYFHGFEKVDAVRSVFGRSTAAVLEKQKVEFISSRFAYMGVNNDDGHMIVGTYHLRNSQLKILYLDVVHELFHVKQHMEGKNLFPEGYEYVDSPIEVPAYQHTVEEARRIGMSYGEIEEYLKVEWITAAQHARLARACGLDPSVRAGPELPLDFVSIDREAPIALHPFVKYFGGFEKLPVVQGLFGAQAGALLKKLKVEFFSARFGYIGVNEEDGHIIAGARHIRESKPESVYLDLVFALHQVKRFQEGRPPFSTRWASAENPAVVSAYKAAVDEGRRIGMTDRELARYLDNAWITPSQHRKLVKAVGLGPAREDKST
ncbi:MAG TPA: hypothetical protein VLY21_03065 [Nitrososphaerales archaeon]|nr:hypothetical protein [Nitrososphaerales archaeon]